MENQSSSSSVNFLDSNFPTSSARLLTTGTCDVFSHNISSSISKRLSENQSQQPLHKLSANNDSLSQLDCLFPGISFSGEQAESFTSEIGVDQNEFFLSKQRLDNIDSSDFSLEFNGLSCFNQQIDETVQNSSIISSSVVVSSTPAVTISSNNHQKPVEEKIPSKCSLRRKSARKESCPKITKLQTEIEALNAANADLRKSNRILKQHNKRLKSEKIDIENSLKSFFNPDQLKALGKKSSRGWNWSEDTINKALALKEACGVNGYEELLKQNYPLPSLRTLYRRLSDMPDKVESNSECGQKNSESVPENDRHSNLVVSSEAMNNVTSTLTVSNDVPSDLFAESTKTSPPPKICDSLISGNHHPKLSDSPGTPLLSHMEDGQPSNESSSLATTACLQRSKSVDTFMSCSGFGEPFLSFDSASTCLSQAMDIMCPPYNQDRKTLCDNKDKVLPFGDIDDLKPLPPYCSIAAVGCTPMVHSETSQSNSYFPINVDQSSSCYSINKSDKLLSEKPSSFSCTSNELSEKPKSLNCSNEPFSECNAMVDSPSFPNISDIHTSDIHTSDILESTSSFGCDMPLLAGPSDGVTNDGDEALGSSDGMFDSANTSNIIYSNELNNTSNYILYEPKSSNAVGRSTPLVLTDENDFLSQMVANSQLPRFNSPPYYSSSSFFIDPQLLPSDPNFNSNELSTPMSSLYSSSSSVPGVENLFDPS